MAFDPQRLLDHAFPDIRHSYDERDAILYALGVGMPLGGAIGEDLDFLIEDRLQVLPTFAVTLASPGMWVREPSLGIDWVRLLHASQSAIFHAPLPRKGDVIGRARIKSLHDRGAESGAVAVVERTIADASNGTLYCTTDQTVIMRGNGGYGGEMPPKPERRALPDRPADMDVTVRLSERAALIYRLSGDINPLHVDPEVARKAGFEKPIMHGLGNYGLAGALIVKHVCGGEAARLKSLALSFSGVVYPGDEIAFKAWREGGEVLFEAYAGARKVLDRGVAVVS